MKPSVQINTLNLRQGSVKEIERTALFVGIGTSHLNQLIPLTADSDLDKVLGKADSELKQQIRSAIRNAGQNWFGYAYQMAQEDYDFVQAVKNANETASFEYCVNTHTLGVDKDFLNSLQTLHIDLLNQYARRTFFIQAIAGINDDEVTGETWEQYVERLTELTRGIVADRVMVVPNLLGKDVGCLAGRLANRTVTIADSPARVKTGALIDFGQADLPRDKEGNILTQAHINSLDLARISTMVWYPDYDGYYWADGKTLDVEGGDYQVIENVRVVDKVARRIRLLALASVADRSFNSTASSIEAHKTYFASVIRQMSQSVQIGPHVFPGECYEPTDDSIEIVWKSKEQVEVYIKVQPLECPKQITANIFLDLKTLGGNE